MGLGTTRATARVDDEMRSEAEMALSAVSPEQLALNGRDGFLRVLSVPAGHVYVRHLSMPGVDDGVTRLADPPVSPDVPQAQWWPPPALDSAWVRDHRDDFDVFHLHFGFDARTPQELSELVRTLRALDKPFVYTVHDLRNPHHDTCDLHDAHLDVLVPAADALITLTPGAAREIDRRWGRDALVLPHPHVVEEPTLSRPRPDRTDFVVGVHLKSLRASMDPIPVVRTLSHAVAGLPGARLKVDVHTDVVTPGYPRYDPAVSAVLEEGRQHGDFELYVHDFYSDDELWDYFQSLDLSVLPYRFGTHSGWLEACYDLGTTVLAADCGFYAQQRPCLLYHLDEQGLDETGLRDAVRLGYDERPQWRADPEARRREREVLAAQHKRLYEGLLK
jgi:hypothetical protein